LDVAGVPAWPEARFHVLCIGDDDSFRDDPKLVEDLDDADAGIPGPHVKHAVLSGTYGVVNVTLKRVVSESAGLLAYALCCAPLSNSPT
jgi:hypothetical protein